MVQHLDQITVLMGLAVAVVAQADELGILVVDLKAPFAILALEPPRILAHRFGILACFQALLRRGQRMGVGSGRVLAGELVVIGPMALDEIISRRYIRLVLGESRKSLMGIGPVRFKHRSPRFYEGFFVSGVHLGARRRQSGHHVARDGRLPRLACAIVFRVHGAQLAVAHADKDRLALVRLGIKYQSDAAVFVRDDE